MYVNSNGRFVHMKNRKWNSLSKSPGILFIRQQSLKASFVGMMHSVRFMPSSQAGLEKDTKFNCEAINFHHSAFLEIAKAFCDDETVRWQFNINRTGREEDTQCLENLKRLTHLWATSCQTILQAGSNPYNIPSAVTL